MRIFLVRHGQSEANIQKSLLKERPDHDIGLSPRGIEQAAAAAAALLPILSDGGLRRTRVWTSPYKRAKQTASIIHAALSMSPDHRGADMLEHIALVEQQFGLFDGLFDGADHTDSEIYKRYPNEYLHYKKHEDFEGRFWARMPLGESRFDATLRVHQSFGTFHRDAERHGIQDIIVVCHGVIIRSFVMMWCHKTVEWFEKERNPANCSIRLIGDDGEDHGYVYAGERNPG